MISLQDRHQKTKSLFMVDQVPFLILLLLFIAELHDVCADSSYFLRNDRNEYLKARGVKYDSNDNQALLDPSILKILRRKLIDNNGRISDSDASFDDPNPCTTYLAPSSIPNSGLGMYTTIPYQERDTFPFPEIGILIQDYHSHYTNPLSGKSLLNQYPWAASVLTFGLHEVSSGDTLVPGLGMLANSHLGLANFRHSDTWWKIDPSIDGTDTLSNEGLKHSTLNGDTGRGAISAHGNVKFYATEYISEGEELFVNYGDDWFTGRESDLGVIPGEDHYKTANNMLQTFWEGIIRDGLADEKGVTELALRYDALLKEAETTHKRLKAAFPKDVHDVPSALEMGTARFSAVHSYQSEEWLQENGVCIDKIVAGVTTIPQAGQGAFATRTIEMNDLITSTPVLTIDLDQILLWKPYEEDDQIHYLLEGYQLLLNYCFGHKDSSLLFFPYSPSVNFINHGNIENANAKIRWSSFSYNKSEWLDGSIEEAKKRMKTGLMFDIIATRDIQRGEEILLYYGEEWEDKWEEHIDQWGSSSNFTESHGLPTTVDLNQESIVKTVEEQETDPYPENIMTRCYFSPPNECMPTAVTIAGVNCQARYALTMQELHLQPCKILSRVAFEDTVWYSAIVDVRNGTEDYRSYFVEYIPRYALRFVDRPYYKDQYRKGAFRHMIGLEDGVIPNHWIDR